MYIKSYESKRFAGLKDVHLEFQDGLNVILGPNESGKSSIVDGIHSTLFKNIKLRKSYNADIDFDFKYMPKPDGDFIDGKVTIKNKDKVLIFGESGTGKTTFVNTLTQNLSDYQGDILYDGINLKDIDLESFRSNVGYVRQEHFIFDDTIKNNITLEKAYHKDKFTSVLKQVDLYDWITSLELKDEHKLLDNGSNISGGQRQRVNIARELYQDKAMIVFDEPSSSLDDYTSSKIYETIKNLDKTVIVISHRHIDYLSESFNQVIDLSEKGGVSDV